MERIKLREREKGERMMLSFLEMCHLEYCSIVSRGYWRPILVTFNIIDLLKKISFSINFKFDK